MSAINARVLVQTMMRLRPDQAESILACARRCNGQANTFCKAIRAEVGGTVLMEALMVLRGSEGDDAAYTPSAALDIYQHALACRSVACKRANCGAMRGMISNLKAHSQSCAADGCITCQQWHKVRDAMQAARRKQRSPRTEVHISRMPSRESAGLVMLSRVALADISPTSARLSPVNTPISSPCTSPVRKRPKEGMLSS